MSHYRLLSAPYIRRWKGGSATLSEYMLSNMASGPAKRAYKLYISLPASSLTAASKRISTVVHYLPKYYLQPEALLWPAISLMDAKRFGFECDKWKTSQARLLSSDPSFPEHGQPELSVSIPRTAQAVAGTCFPLNVTIRVPGASPAVLSHYLDKLTIQMIKRVTIIASGNKSSHLTSFGKIYPQQIERELVSSDTRIWRGGLRGGCIHGEASWSAGQLFSVEVSTLSRLL